MPRTKLLEFNIGDIVQSKKYDKRNLLIVEKNIKSYAKLAEYLNSRYGPIDNYEYVAIDIDTNDQCYIFNNINNKHYKILG